MHVYIHVYIYTDIPVNCTSLYTITSNNSFFIYFQLNHDETNSNTNLQRKKQAVSFMMNLKDFHNVKEVYVYVNILYEHTSLSVY